MTIFQLIKTYKSENNSHKYQLIPDAANLFLNDFQYGVNTKEELELGILLLNELIKLSYTGSLREYENNFDLQNEILSKKIRVFKKCIPESHAKLRGYTEMLIGMKENELG
ncbi:MAG: hypothetical protein J0L69_12855 [Bacteroidetes bacterium]|nr:hypothetical protein [Bacteroidota bacterium]